MTIDRGASISSPRVLVCAEQKQKKKKIVPFGSRNSPEDFGKITVEVVVKIIIKQRSGMTGFNI